MAGISRDDIQYRLLSEAQPRRIYRFPMAEGDDGVRDTLTIMAHLVEEARGEPIVLKTAWMLTENLAPEQVRDKAEAVFDYTRGISRDPKARTRSRFPGADALQWRPDPALTELIQDAPLVILHGGADCEELSMVLASLLQAVGLESEFVVVSRREDQDFHHVLVRIPIDEQRSLYLDPSVPRPMNTVPLGITRAWAASTFLNPNGKVDIKTISPETVRGTETYGETSTFTFGESSMPSTQLGAIPPSILGSISFYGLSGLDGGFSLTRKLDNEGPRVTGVSRLEADFKKDIDGLTAWIKLNAGKFAGGGARYLNPLERARTRIREIVVQWINDSDVTDDAAKTAIRNETKKGPNGYLQVWIDAQAESGLTYALPSEGGSGLKLPGDLTPAQIQQLQGAVSAYGGSKPGSDTQPDSGSSTVPQITFDPVTGRPTITQPPQGGTGMSWGTIGLIAAALGVPVVVVLGWLLLRKK